jgi:hypothetical protein
LPPTVTWGAFTISVWLTKLTYFFAIIRPVSFTFGVIFIAAFTWAFCVFTFTFFTLWWTTGSLFMSWRWPWIRRVVCSTFLSAFIQPFRVTCTWVWFRFLVCCLWVRPRCCFILKGLPYSGNMYFEEDLVRGWLGVGYVLLLALGRLRMLAADNLSVCAFMRWICKEMIPKLRNIHLGVTRRRKDQPFFLSVTYRVLDDLQSQNKYWTDTRLMAKRRDSFA